MKDRIGRNIDYMYISVTDRCNLDCRYCRHACYNDSVPREDVLTNGDILRICEAAASLGIKSLKITGGEPLLRNGIAELVADLKKTDGIETVSLSTNGLMLYPLLPELKEAGIDSISIHLDTSQVHQYKWLTRGKLSPQEVFKALWRSLELGIPTKLNCTMLQETKDEILVLAGLAKFYPVDIKFNSLLPIGSYSVTPLSADETLRVLMKKYPDLGPVAAENANGPAQYYGSRELKGKIGITDIKKFSSCAGCSSIYLTSRGKLNSCLCSGEESDLYELLKENAGHSEIKARMRGLIYDKKPECMYSDADLIQ